MTVSIAPVMPDRKIHRPALLVWIMVFLTDGGNLRDATDERKSISHRDCIGFFAQRIGANRRDLKVALDEYFTKAAEYNPAELWMFHVLGHPARELAINRPLGEVQSVETTRPVYLPPVGDGPPPANRRRGRRGLISRG
jgi:hypothetical protein